MPLNTLTVSSVMKCPEQETHVISIHSGTFKSKSPHVCTAFINVGRVQVAQYYVSTQLRTGPLIALGPNFQWWDSCVVTIDNVYSFMVSPASVVIAVSNKPKGRNSTISAKKWTAKAPVILTRYYYFLFANQPKRSYVLDDCSILWIEPYSNIYSSRVSAFSISGWVIWTRIRQNHRWEPLKSRLFFLK